MKDLRNEAINLIETVPEKHLESVVSILKNVHNKTDVESEKKRVDWKKIIEKYSGSVDCFKDIDVEAYIKESRGYDRV